MNRQYNRILVIRFSSLGDLLLTTPALRALKRWNPESEIHLVLKPEYSCLFLDNTNVDKIITIDPSTGIFGFLKFALSLRGNYDLLVDLQRSLKSLVIRWLSDARIKLKYPKGIISRFIMIRTGWKAIAMKEPIAERYLKALEPLGFISNGDGIDLPISETIKEEVRASIVEETDALHLPGDIPYSYLALAPGAGWATKRWLPERFAQAADRLAERYSLVTLLIGHSDEEEITREIFETMKFPAIDLSGRLSLLETGALLEISRLLLCNDSGIMHMAAGLSTPIVAIFGPTTRELGFYPYKANFEVANSEIQCRPCHHIGSNLCPRGHHQCMTDIDVEDVIRFAGKFLDQDYDPVLNPGRENEVS